MPDQNPLKIKQYMELREPICKLSGTIDLNRGLSWVTQKCVLYSISVLHHMPKIVTVPMITRGQKKNQVLWSQVQGGGGCQGEDIHAEPLSLFILAKLLKEFLHWAKAEVFFHFSLGFLLASGLQENVFLELKLFQAKFCKWDLMVTVPSISASFLPQHKNHSVQQCQLQLGPASWKRSRKSDTTALPHPGSQFQPLPKFLAPDAACISALTQFHLSLLMELLPPGEMSSWMVWNKWIKGHWTVYGLL